MFVSFYVKVGYEQQSIWSVSFSEWRNQVEMFANKFDAIEMPLLSNWTQQTSTGSFCFSQRMKNAWMNLSQYYYKALGWCYCRGGIESRFLNSEIEHNGSIIPDADFHNSIIFPGTVASIASFVVTSLPNWPRKMKNKNAVDERRVSIEI